MAPPIEIGPDVPKRTSPNGFPSFAMKAMKAKKIKETMKVKAAAPASMDPVVSLFYKREARWEASDGAKKAEKAKKAEQRERAGEREWKATKMKETMVAHAMKAMKAKAMKAIPMKVMKAKAAAPASAMKAMKSMKAKKAMKLQRPRLLWVQPADQKMLHEQQEQRRQHRSGARKAGDNSAPLLFTRKNGGY